MAALISPRGDSSEEQKTKEDLDRLTADEAEQYDRQIRLWGLDAQKRWGLSWIHYVPSMFFTQVKG